MGWFSRDRAEKVVEYHHYPEAQFISNRPRLAWWYRFLLGRPMDNVRWTNSTFFSPASRGEPHRWLRLAGWQRLVIRLALLWLALLVLPVLALALLRQWGALLSLAHAHLVVLSPVLLAVECSQIRERGLRLPLLVREQTEYTAEQVESMDAEQLKRDAPTVRRLRIVQVYEGRREWQRTVVEPLAKALAERMDNIFRSGDLEWIRVPRNYLEPGGKSVEIMLPANFGGDPASIRGIERVVGNKLGLQDPVFSWQLAGNHPRMLVSCPPQPPKVAHWREYMDTFAQVSEEYRPVLGVGANNELVSAEMIDASPHIGLSAGSGAGKSMLMRAVIMQALHWGWSVIILDWKAESHEWAQGLPGVTIVTDIEGIHEMGERIGQEVDIRKALSKEERALRPRVLVVREEWNMTSVLLWEYWARLRNMAEPDERRAMPVRSPALMGFQSLDFAGRAFGMFDFLAAQRFSSRVFNGNADLRENFQIRLLSRYTPQTWKMLIPELKPVRKPKELGRWVVWAQDEIVHVQALLVTESEAREYASAGISNAASPFASVNAGVTQRTNVGTSTHITLGDSLGHDPARPRELPPRTLKSLADMVDALSHLGVTESVLRNWRKRDPSGFPGIQGGSANAGWLYDLDEMAAYARSRRAAQAAEREIR